MQTTDTFPRRATNGDETDVIGAGRTHLCCLRRAGVTAKTKRRIRRRERREGHVLVRAELRDVRPAR